jgi:small GTP-binding protein
LGKTSLRKSYLGEGFITSHLATLGVDFAQKRFVLDVIPIRLIIWDLAGQPSYEKVRRHYYEGCSGIVLVYSVVDRRSFDNASKWLVEAYKYMGKLPPTAVLANKIDLRPGSPPGNSVTNDEGQKFARYFAEKLSVPVIFEETSALTGESITEAFTKLARAMIELDDRMRLNRTPPSVSGPKDSI